MADTPMGFRPVMHRGGAPYNGAVNLYMATSGAAIYLGDAVLITGQSNATEIEGMVPGSVPIVNVPGTTDTSKISGIVVGVVPSDATSTPYRPATKANRLLWVMDDPNVLLEVQVDGTVTQDDVGNATSLITTHAGSTVTGRSGQEVSATTATQGVFVIERLVPKPDNDLASANSKVLVSVRKHTRNQTGGGVANLGLGIA